MNKLLIQTKLFIILFKLAQLLNFLSALIKGKLHYPQDAFETIGQNHKPCMALSGNSQFHEFINDS